jgi:hypothetical protein
MPHEQEFTAHILIWGSVLYAAWFVWYLKHGETKYNPRVWENVAASVDKFFKFLLAVYFLVCVSIKTDYNTRYLNDVNGTSTTDFPLVVQNYFLGLEWVSMATVIWLGIAKFSYHVSPAAWQSRLMQTTKTTMVVWLMFYLTWCICITCHAMMSGAGAKGAMDNADIVAATGMIAYGIAYVGGFFAQHRGTNRRGEITFLDSNHEAKKTREHNDAFGNSHGYIVQMKMETLHVFTLCVWSLYTWIELFNDYGALSFVVSLQLVAAVFMMWWSGNSHSFMDVFIFCTFFVSHVFAFFPGVIFWGARNPTAVPTGSEYRHLQLLMDFANTAMQWDTNVMFLVSLALAGVGMVTSGLCLAGFLAELNDRRSGSAVTSVQGIEEAEQTQGLTSGAQDASLRYRALKKTVQ